MNDALEQMLPEISKAADRIGREWAAVTTAEDIEQEIILHLLDKGTVEKLAGFDSGARYTTLVKIGTQLAAQERVDYDYFTGNFCYSTKEVRKLLEEGILTEERVSTNTERMDVDEGSQLLADRNERYAGLIAKRYFFGDKVDEARALSRAVDALTDCMNRVHNNRIRQYEDGPGTRTVVSNSQAQRIISSQYSGHGSTDLHSYHTGEF